MSDLIHKGVIEIAGDASGVVASVEASKKSLDNLASHATQAGSRASAGINQIGAGGNAAASSVDAATNNMIRSIQRATASMQAGSKGSADYYRSLANFRGVKADSLEPYLRQLDEATQKQRMMKASMAAVDPTVQKLGMSQKQLAFAMRGIPAQMTDIVVGLQSGQKPFTVLLQQGGQLKDMFGGIGPAFKALGSYALSIINPFTLAAAAVGTLGYAFYKGADESERLQRALIVSGNAAGMTADELSGLAQKAGEMTGQYGVAREAAEALASAGVFSGDTMKATLDAVVNEAAVTGESVTKLVETFTQISDKPSDSVIKLNEKYNFLTADVYKQIVALEKQGKTQEAAKVIFEEFSKSMKERTPDILENMGYISYGWRQITKAINWAKDALMEFGRDEKISEKLAKEKAYLESLSRAQFEGAEEQRKIVMENIAYYEKQEAAQKASAKAAGESAAANREAIKKIHEESKKKPKVDREKQAYDNLIQSIKSKIEAHQIEIQTGDAATEAQKMRIKLDNQEAGSRNALTEAHKRSAKALLDKLEATEREAKQTKFARDYTKEYTTEKLALVQQYQTEINSIGLTTREAEKLADANKILFDAEEKVRKARLDKSIDAGTEKKILDDAREKVKLLNSLKSEKYQKEQDPWVQLQKSVKQYGEDAQNVGKQVRDALTDAFKAAEDAIVKFATTGKISFGDFVESVLAGLVRIQAQKMISGLAEGLTSVLGKTLGGYFDYKFGDGLGSEYAKNEIFGSGNIPGKASGGPVSSGKTYLVGERGPELFSPYSPGTIIPNHMLGGFGAMQIQINHKNEGTKQEVTSSSADFDGNTMVINIVTRDIENDGLVSKAIMRNFGASRAAGAY